MINFVLPSSRNAYFRLINIMINNIMGDKPRTYSPFTIDDMINVHFFLEENVLETVGMRGVNVFIPHGIADKGYRNYESVKGFDYVVISGPIWNEKLEGFDPERIILGGYPKMDKVFSMPRNPQYVLWLPTHNFSLENVSSFPDLWEEILASGTVPTKIETSVHPANDKNSKPTEFEILDAQVVIADLGSTVYEAWAMNIPVVFPDWLVKDKVLKYYPDTLESQIFQGNLGYHAANLDGLFGMIEEAKNRPIDQNIIAFMDEVFPRHLRGSSGNTIYEKLQWLSRINKFDKNEVV